MDWFREFLWSDSIAHAIVIYAFVIALGVALGKIRVFGISLGITFVLFAGIALGHFGFAVNHTVVEFAKDFGLILFVFFIGLQVGPGFFSSFRKGGISLNLMALAIVLLGGLTTLILHWITGTSLPMMVGIMSGAVTNTPGLGAAQEALQQVSAVNPPSDVPEIGLGYAVAYPLGVIGVILTMVLISKVFRVDAASELDQFNERLHPPETLPERAGIRVTNPKAFNKTILELASDLKMEYVISRIWHGGEFHSATSSTVIRENDIVLVVAEKGLLPRIISELGILSETDITRERSALVSRNVLVTRREVIGKALGTLKLRNRYQVNITRIHRSGIEFVASPHLKLLMGDKVTIVGEEDCIEQVAAELGNSIKRLNEPNIIPVFIGILLGVVLGSVPIFVPGIPNPVRLGMAGGPLIISILLSRYGYRFSLTSYTTPSANLMMREVGIVLFLASVGIKAGEKFIPTLLSGDGFLWMGYGAAITLIPILFTGFFARCFLKRNFFEICGLLSGSMTDPPALAFANSLAQSEAPAVAYATVYPMVMFLRIFMAQLLILFFA